MEELSNRFPALIPMVMENVDNESLVNFKDTSREMSVFIVNERFYWIRILKKYNRNFQEFSKVWNMVIEKTPVDIIKKLVLAVEKFMIKRTWSDFFWRRHERQWSRLLFTLRQNVGIWFFWNMSFQEQRMKITNIQKTRPMIFQHFIWLLKKDIWRLVNLLSIVHCTRVIKTGIEGLPIDYAAIFGNLEVCRFLLQNLDDFPIGWFENTLAGCSSLWTHRNFQVILWT